MFPFLTLGKDAKTVVRKKPVEESEEEKIERLKREAREVLVKEKFQQLGKGGNAHVFCIFSDKLYRWSFIIAGLKQLADNRAARAELEDVAEKPFARYEGDEDRDAFLKSQLRSGDPMAAFLAASSSSADASSMQSLHTPIIRTIHYMNDTMYSIQ